MHCRSLRSLRGGYGYACGRYLLPLRFRGDNRFERAASPLARGDNSGVGYRRTLRGYRAYAQHRYRVFGNHHLRARIFGRGEIFKRDCHGGGLCRLRVLYRSLRLPRSAYSRVLLTAISVLLFAVVAQRRELRAVEAAALRYRSTDGHGGCPLAQMHGGKALPHIRSVQGD